MAQPEGTFCTYCGMTCAPGEYHSYGVCLMFKTCRNSETVRANLAAMREHYRAEARKQDEALIRQMLEALEVAFDQTCSVGRAADWAALNAAIAAARARLGTNPPPGPDVPKPEA